MKNRLLPLAAAALLLLDPATAARSAPPTRGMQRLDLVTTPGALCRVRRAGRLLRQIAMPAAPARNSVSMPVALAAGGPPIMVTCSRAGYRTRVQVAAWSTRHRTSATLDLVLPKADAPLPALFARFKAICLDTDAEPDAVEAAVLAAGGKPLVLSGRAASALRPGTGIWSLTVAGKPASVGTMRLPVPASDNTRGRSALGCSVRGAGGAADIAAAGDWAQVMPSHPAPDQDSYDYRPDHAGALTAVRGPDAIQFQLMRSGAP